MKTLLLFFLLFTPKDIHAFVESDKTNEIQYSEDFDCKDFTETFIENAVGFNAYPVGVGLRYGDTLVFHQFVGVEIDGKVYWIEPQSDQFYEVAEAGEMLCFVDGECFAELAFVY
jgi:hypothetical protein